MADQFPLQPDAVWFDAMVERYGNAVPSIEHMRFRRGLQRHVGHMYATLHDLDLLRHVEIIDIETRAAAFVIVDARVRAGAFEAERIALDCALEHAQEQLAASCEQCGKPGDIVLKIGVEAQLADPGVELGDRFLCTECYESWVFREGAQ